MFHSREARVAMAACGLLLAGGCGGGGGGGGGERIDPVPTPQETTLSVGSKSISVAANYGDAAPTHSVRLTVSNPPEEGLYAAVTLAGAAVENVAFVPISGTLADLRLFLRTPLELPVGTITDTITVEVCHDDQCSRQVRGSPASITVSYSVASPSAVALATPSVSVVVNRGEWQSPTATAVVNVSKPPAGGVHFSIVGQSSHVQSVTNRSGNTGIADLELTFHSPYSVGVGVHDEDVAVRACYDWTCTREIAGSPLVIHTQYTVKNGARPEDGVEPLTYLSRTALAHDVVDAEYVRARDAIVMVSSKPTDALYLYDVATGTERSLPLARAPTAVSVAPDGQSLAVGHDALITHVDLAALVAGAPSARQLDVSTRVFDLVLDGRGYVHALPAADQWVDIHSVHVATNTETRTWGQLYAGAHGRLHPSGDSMYTADNGLSPSDIAKYDLRSGIASRLYDSPYHGDYAMCGNLWFKEDGATIYTKCGNTFRASTQRSQDMLYSGRLPLSPSSSYGYQIDWLSQSDATGKIALLESDWYECAPFRSNERCYSRLAVHDSVSLNRSSLHSLAPIEVAGDTWNQRGLFVFHSRDGLRRYLLSRIDATAGTTPTHFLTVVQ